jgi:ribose transport system permease protein
MMLTRLKNGTVTQEGIVIVISILMFVVFAATNSVFRAPDNIISLVQNVSVLGILAVAMALTIIGRGIDLSLVAVMAISAAWVLQLQNHGMPIGLSIGAGLVLALSIGLINGVLIAYLEIPAIFATLAIATAAYGFVRALLLEDNLIYLKAGQDSWFKTIGSGDFMGIPNPVILFAIVALIVHLFLKYAVAGRFLYAMGENPTAARTAGLPNRPMILLQYVMASGIAFLAGLIMATSVDSIETRIARSTLVYDIILVVVIGGIGLSGGKGRVRNVIVGTLMIGILLNGMTILNTPYTLQNIIKSVILLIAIVVDSVMNPRDEQTSQQGDI